MMTSKSAGRRVAGLRAAAAGTVALAVLLTTGVDPGVTTTATEVASSTAASGSADASSAARIRALAAHLGVSPADTQTGRYAYHHIRRWILDTTGMPAPRPNTPAVSAVEICRWEADNGAAYGSDAELPPDYTLAGASPNHHSTDAEFRQATITPVNRPPGNLSSPLKQRGPLSADPATLARQLAYDPLPDGPQATLRAVEEMYTVYAVTLPVRAAALRVLADITGIAYHERVADRLGRIGVAVSLDARNLRFSLIFDPATGQLLASEQRLIGPHDYLPVPVGLVTYYTLFVDQGHRPRPRRTGK